MPDFIGLMPRGVQGSNPYPRLITGEVKEGLVVDEVQVEQS